jgi:hypothetical protein
MKRTLKCNCGQNVLTRDVMQQAYYARQFGPSYVYVRFRCSRCKKLGEHFVRQQDWEEGMLADEGTEATPAEKRRFEGLGKITMDEMVKFHEELNRLTDMPKVLDEN